MLLFLLILVYLVNGIKINNQFLQEPEDVETIIGSTLILHCRTEPLDENQVTWCKNDFCTLGKTRDLPFYPRYEIIGQAHQGEHHFKIVNVSLEDMGMYQCQIRAGARRAGSMSRKAKLTVLQIPTSLSLDSPIVLIENVLSFIVCRAQNAMPEAKLSWHLPKSISYLSKNDYALISDQSLRNSISNITFIPNRLYHGKLIQCQAHSSAIDIMNKTMITQQYIQTIFSPEINISLIGEQTENERINISCNVYCRPNLEKIKWFNGSSLLNLTDKNHFELLLTRYMHKNQIICQATNQVGTQNQSVTLLINYKPIFIDNYGNQIKNYSVILVEEGESVELQCLVDSYPSSYISWMFNQQTILKNATSLKISNIQSTNHTGVYICSANHSIFGIFNRTIRVALKGPPEMISETTVNSIYVGQSILLVCSISTDIPIENIYWSREGHSRLNSNEKYEISENRSDELIEYKLLIKFILSSDEGDYICTGINQYGSSATKFQLRVINLKNYFIQRSFLYGSIFLGLFFCFILISFSLINHYRQKNDQRIRKKSSTTDETISSLAKQQENIQHDYQDETNSNIDQYLYHEQLINNHQRNNIFHSSQNDLFYFKDNIERFSTVV
ncbi:unnamed protein product [Adineta steineri]|uniref:Ig-like domain-containing protein n=1 Tax=Adineta steineri TaxID=433720 RepID=A0A819ICX6_9BILA|nr:unnamed protein product [Adineta steineri]CAF3910089.1 unnamed protein product [Adineta steineri]